MKIRIETGGAGAAKPDFGMLREGLRVAQQTTPTAIASGRVRAPHDRDALVNLFAGAKPPARAQGRFHPGLPPALPAETER